jgi:hypothetical protein
MPNHIIISIQIFSAIVISKILTLESAINSHLEQQQKERTVKGS